MGGATPEYVDSAADRVGPEADCYAFAVLLFELVYGRLPGGEGTRFRGPRQPLTPLDEAAEALGRAACAALAAAHLEPWGFLDFANVIESAAQAHC